MLSLGREIVTGHGHYIDNLYLDGNGSIVIAELKRGRSTRDVHAQVIEYGAFAESLSWGDIERYCESHNAAKLSDAYRACFGRALDCSGDPSHRLLIFAETFDQRALDAGSYLLNRGVPLALLEFSFFALDTGAVLQTRTVVGEIPEQAPPGIELKDNTDRAASGYNAWLFERVAAALEETALAQGWSSQYRIGKQSVSFANAHWPTAYGQCQMLVSTWSKDDVTLWLYFDETAAPGLKEYLVEREGRWKEHFPAEPSASSNSKNIVSLMYRIPSPAMGDEVAVNELTTKVGRMTGAIVPLLNEFFDNHNGRTE